MFPKNIKWNFQFVPCFCPFGPIMCTHKTLNLHRGKRWKCTLGKCICLRRVFYHVVHNYLGYSQAPIWNWIAWYIFHDRWGKKSWKRYVNTHNYAISSSLNEEQEKLFRKDLYWLCHFFTLKDLTKAQKSVIFEKLPF